MILWGTEALISSHFSQARFEQWGNWTHKAALSKPEIQYWSIYRLWHGCSQTNAACVGVKCRVRALILSSCFERLFALGFSLPLSLFSFSLFFFFVFYLGEKEKITFLNVPLKNRVFLTLYLLSVLHSDFSDQLLCLQACSRLKTSIFIIFLLLLFCPLSSPYWKLGAICKYSSGS